MQAAPLGEVVGDNSQNAFAGQGRMKSEQLKIAGLNAKRPRWPPPRDHELPKKSLVPAPLKTQVSHPDTFIVQRTTMQHNLFRKSGSGIGCLRLNSAGHMPRIAEAWRRLPMLLPASQRFFERWFIAGPRWRAQRTATTPFSVKMVSSNASMAASHFRHFGNISSNRVRSLSGSCAQRLALSCPRRIRSDGRRSRQMEGRPSSASCSGHCPIERDVRRNLREGFLPGLIRRRLSSSERCCGLPCGRDVWWFWLTVQRFFIDRFALSS